MALEVVRHRQQELLELVRSKSNFWDAVVLTASDTAQQALYESLLQQRVAARLLPKHTKYIVLADPPPSKHRIGNGGAAVLALHHLQKALGAAFPHQTRVLLFHSGGYAMRSPNLSALGKVFAPLPIDGLLGHPCGTIFDLKVALYTPWAAPTAACGVFIASGDVFDLFDATQFPLTTSGCTALGHWDTLQYAALHGVFEVDNMDSHSSVALAYHQKPDMDTMKRICHEDRVLTDSDFFMAADMCEALMQCAVELPSPYGEVCGWSHFLPAMAPNSPPWTSQREDLVTLAECLRSYPLHVANVSQDPHHRFYHLGTMPEYRQYLTKDLCSKRILGSTVSSSIVAPDTAVMASTLVDTVVGPGTVVEFCNLRNAAIGANCIISGVVWSDAENTLHIPDGIVLTTIPLENGTVTVFFGVEDDLKGIKSHCGMPLPPGDVSLFQLPIFPVSEHPDLTESTRLSVAALHSLREGAKVTPTGGSYMSLSQAVQHKSASRIVAMTAIPPGPALRKFLLVSSQQVVIPTLPVQDCSIELPVRLVLAGGWSDTPPICLAYGGAVFNVASRLDGMLPVKASVTVQDVGITVESLDGPHKEVLSEWPQLDGHFDPHGDPLALHKAVLAVVGCRTTGGICLSTDCRGVPKGSGLGTSSILMLACVRALLGGTKLPHPDEVDLVLAVEAALGTGGGWQDQVGGGYPGAKLTTGHSGGDLVVKEWKGDAARLNGHLFCVNTQVTRMAKVVLDRVIDNYATRRTDVVHIVSQALQLNAHNMFDGWQKLNEDWDGGLQVIGQELATYRGHCEALAGGAFICPAIADVMEVVDRHCYGGCNLMGAGAGGFILGFLKTPGTQQQVFDEVKAAGEVAGVNVSLVAMEIEM